MKEAIIRVCPRDPVRHLYHVGRVTRQMVTNYRPSSTPLLHYHPHGVVSATVQWVWDEGRAAFETSQSVMKRVDKEGEHAKRNMEMVKKQFGIQQKVINRFKS